MLYIYLFWLSYTWSGNDENHVFLTCQVVRVGGYLSLTTSLKIYFQGRGQESNCKYLITVVKQTE